MLNFFVKDFSGTIKARSLKLGILSNHDNLYRVRVNGHYHLICSSVLSFFFLSISRLVLFFFFSGTVKARSLGLDILYNDDDLYSVRDNELSRITCSSVLLFFFPSISRPMIKFRQRFLRNHKS